MTENILRDEQQLRQLHDAFTTAEPFSYCCIDNFLEPSLALSLSERFPALSQMDVLYNGLNENKGEHATFDTLHEDFKKLKNRLFTKGFSERVEKITGIAGLQLIDDRYGCGLHQGGARSFLDVHIDYNLHPLKKKQRRLNLILFLNQTWEQDWGGYLELWNASGTQCVTRIAPAFNRCVLFVCNDISYHGYSQIRCPDDITRKSFYLYFFTEPIGKLLYHDTVFSHGATNTTARKYQVLAKEFVKNQVKRALYYSGFNRLLK